MTRSLVAELLREAAHAQVRFVDKPWGREFVLRLGDALVKVIQVNEGGRTSLQHHERKHEVIFVLDGGGVIEGTHDQMNMFMERPSRPYLIVPGQMHRAVGPLTLLEITTDDDDDDVVRHRDDYGREMT